MARWARPDGPARERPEKTRPENGPAWRGPCLGLGRHDCQAVPRLPPRKPLQFDSSTATRISPHPCSSAVGFDHLRPLDRHLEAEYITCLIGSPPTLTLAALPIPTRSRLHRQWAMASPLPDSLPPPPSFGRRRPEHRRAPLPWGQGGDRDSVGPRRWPRWHRAVMWPRRTGGSRAASATAWCASALRSARCGASLWPRRVVWCRSAARWCWTVSPAVVMWCWTASATA
jgi:hypothetical protein